MEILPLTKTSLKTFSFFHPHPTAGLDFLSEYSRRSARRNVAGNFLDVDSPTRSRLRAGSGMNNPTPSMQL